MDERLFTTPEGRTRLEGELLPRWLPSCRWFGGKARTLRGLKIAASERLGGAWLLALVVEYEDGSETYAVPLALSRDPVEAIVAEKDGTRLFDATHSPEFRAALFRLMADSPTGALRGERGSIFGSLFPDGATPESRVLKAEQSNTSLIYGERLFVKLYRKLVPGGNPDAEITRFLSERAGFRHVPAFGGAVEWNGASLALGSMVVSHDGDGWSVAIADVQQFFSAGPIDFADRTCFTEGEFVSPEWHQRVRSLGQRTGELHRALSEFDVPDAFRPESLTPQDVSDLSRQLTASLREVYEALGQRWDALPREVRPLIEELLVREPKLMRKARLVSDLRPAVLKIRVHGDYHLGQVLFTGTDCLILDFEGEPSRSLDARRAKQSPLKDVAGMLRSFHYAAYAGMSGSAAEREKLGGKAVAWAAICDSVFRRAWAAVADGVPGVGMTDCEAGLLLDAYVLQKALYETLYELNNRPDWLHIPLRGVAALA